MTGQFATEYSGHHQRNNQLPSIQIIDFNNDGHLDLKIQMSTNINGNEWVELFLYNPLTQQINVLKNEAEDGIIWDAPKYQLKDSTIHCVRVAGVWGLSFESIYKLKGIQAFPLDKKEYDTTEMNYTGRGGIYRHYVGNKSKWKLIKKTTYRPH